MSENEATAGLRGAGWDAGLMDRPYQVDAVTLNTADGGKTMGFLFSVTGKETTVVSVMHPREFQLSHYLVPAVLDAGCACWVQAPRSIGNDLRLEHEIALFDVAAGMAHLRKLGFRKIALLGNSGGAPLYAMYNQQSKLPPEQRIERTPGGRPTKLAELEMPQVDGMIFVAPHGGQGKLLMAAIDGSVTDENDPLNVDPSLDPFSPANGFNPMTGKAKYTPEFIERYRAAQVARVERLDQKAKQMLKAKIGAKKKLAEEKSLELKKLASWAPIFNVWRTDADLRTWDPSLDPNDRPAGGLWGRDPFISNLGSVGFARVVTPESWLSTWSGISSNASLEKCSAAISQPFLLVCYSGDQAAFPSDIEQIYKQIPSTQKVMHRVRGNHHGAALAEGEEPGRNIAAQHIGNWLRAFN
jgi:pimeloyl-ACP methyl ester carboxylesterase